MMIFVGLRKRTLNSIQQHGKGILKKMKAEANIEFYKVEKFLIKLELIFLKFMENFQNNFKKIYLVLKKIQDFGHLEFL